MLIASKASAISRTTSCGSATSLSQASLLCLFLFFLTLLLGLFCSLDSSEWKFLSFHTVYQSSTLLRTRICSVHMNSQRTIEGSNLSSQLSFDMQRAVV